ncbi:hypothetical protein TKV_c03830 [Thermoanaerobacter kivui]|uniref:YcaO domain-containing protein n=1 Tax=Thermoanaerobacter kivui TaxID=2325 RepID=A0A097AP41_THEKI|nr:YcaO-like family protein [Thermoanaerobacter kivui]AIS51587.1 hypothetical protein TKV_c03830 [Thermoanaerobacter kivui]
MGLNINVINKRKICEPQITQIDDYLNYKEMMSFVGYFNLIKKVDIVLAPSSELPLFIGNCEFANLTYLFNYLLRRTSMSIRLEESIFAGGKGFSYYKAICSSLGEAFERLMGCLDYFNQRENVLVGTYNKLIKEGYKLIDPAKINIFSDEQFNEKDFLFDKFDRNSIVGWIKMLDMDTHEGIYVPASLIMMYYERQDSKERRIAYATSGGLTSHFNELYGYEHGLLEIIERHEINLSWYCKIPPKEIVLNEIEDKRLLQYKDYIKEKNIRFYRHNIDQEVFHVVTAVSFDKDMEKYSFNTGGGISGDIESAILSALEEYAQSVNNTRKVLYAPKWLTSIYVNRVLDVQEEEDPRKFKVFYQAVSYYGLKRHKEKLSWYLENNEKIYLSEIKKNQERISVTDYLKKEKIRPLCLKIMPGRFNHIFISKVFMVEFVPAFIAGIPMLGHEKYKEYLKEGEEINKDILPYP